MKVINAWSIGMGESATSGTICLSLMVKWFSIQQPFELSVWDIDDIPHFARIVEEKFNQKFVETIKGLRSIHHNEFSINVYEPYCKGLEAHFDGKQKADDRSEFVGEIYSMRLFSNSRLVFGPRGVVNWLFQKKRFSFIFEQGNMFSVKDHEYDLPLRVGNMISFDAESQTEKHAIRMEHLKAKSASL